MAEAICNATGKGLIDIDTRQEEELGLFEIDISAFDLDAIKGLKKRWGKKVYGDDSIQS